jgi:hypothetical protein
MLYSTEARAGYSVASLGNHTGAIHHEREAGYYLCGGAILDSEDLYDDVYRGNILLCKINADGLCTDTGFTHSFIKI